MQAATINGHNNYMASQGNFTSAHCNSLGRLDNLIVQGHNNRFENLVVNTLIINGHNNQFSGIYCNNIVN